MKAFNVMYLFTSILEKYIIPASLWGLVLINAWIISRNTQSIPSADISSLKAQKYSEMEQEYVKDELATHSMPVVRKLQGFKVYCSCYANGYNTHSIDWDEMLVGDCGHAEFKMNGHIIDLQIHDNNDGSYDWKVQYDYDIRQLHKWKPDRDADIQLVMFGDFWSVRLVKIELK